MKNIYIGIILAFVLVFVFLGVETIRDVDSDTLMIIQEIRDFSVPYNIPNDVTETIKEGKFTYEYTIKKDLLPSEGTSVVNYVIPVKVYYDVINTDIYKDFYVHDGYFYATVTTSNDVSYFRFVKMYLPYGFEFFFSGLSIGYSNIADLFNNEFHQGFPSVPESDNVIDYVRYIVESFGHSIKSVVYSVEFILYPFNLLRGVFL